MEAENACGLTARTGGEDYCLAVTGSQERVIVWDNGPYTTAKDKLEAGWEYKGEKPVAAKG